MEGPLAGGLLGAGIERCLKNSLAARMSVGPYLIPVGLDRGVGLGAENRTKEQGARDDDVFHWLSPLRRLRHRAPKPSRDRHDFEDRSAGTIAW
jgi:hypothetical protein